jgi:excisionase family DNA binding protein
LAFKKPQNALQFLISQKIDTTFSFKLNCRRAKEIISVARRLFYFEGAKTVEDKLLKAKEVAELFRVDVQRIYQLTRENSIPFVKLGERQYRYSKRSLDEFIERSNNQTESEVRNAQ